MFLVFWGREVTEVVTAVGGGTGIGSERSVTSEKEKLKSYSLSLCSSPFTGPDHELSFFFSKQCGSIGKIAGMVFSVREDESSKYMRRHGERHRASET